MTGRSTSSTFDWRALSLGIAFALMWSSAFTAARIIVAEAPPLSLLAVRFALGGLLAIAVARALGQSWRLSRAQWRATLIFGLCQNALYLGLYFVAMQRVEASLAAIVAASMPLLVALMGRVFLAQRLSPLAWAGLAAGLGGVVLIMSARLQGGADPFGLTLCLIGVLALTVATLFLRGTASGGNVLMIVGLQMVAGSAALAPVAFWREGAALAALPLTPHLLAAFAYITLISGLAATVVWFLLVNRIGAVPAATFHFLNPVFGVAIAALLLGEAVGPVDAIGVLIITGGILAVQRARLGAMAAPPAPGG